MSGYVYHFWFSEKMRNSIRSTGGHDRNQCLVNGKLHYYTLAQIERTENGGCGWDDMQYLGKGTIAELGRS